MNPCFGFLFFGSKGWIFGLGVAMFLRWDFGAMGFLWLDVCVLCWQWGWWLVLSFEAPAMGVMGHGSHRVSAMAVGLVACVEL